MRGGADFDEFGYVGRLWGLDETGAFQANSLGYPTGDYAHPEGGFDWLTQLGIDGGESDGFTAARVANGVTTPPRTSKPTRLPIKLSRPEYFSNNRAFRLDVSEDGGATRSQIPATEATLLTEGYFGIMLRADNLAKVNRESFGEVGKKKLAEPAESWMGLLLAGNQKLRFYLTCLVELDIAVRYDAGIDAGAITRTPSATIFETDIVEVWQSPSSVVGDGTWARLDDRVITASAAGADRTNNLKDLAERLRNENSQMRYSITASHFLIQPWLYSVGDVIQRVAGRNVDFGLFNSNTGETRYPSVVSVTIDAYPTQNITTVIGAEAARRGV